MNTTIQKLFSWYKYLNEDIADPRTANYILIGSPWPVLGLIGCYLYFIYSLGPRFMKERQSFNLDRIVQLYNIVQILLNMYIFYEGFVRWLSYSFICEPIDFSWTPDALMITKLCWVYFLMKILDLLDTVFFVLRKKKNQVTFLHTYHHVGMILASWICVKYLPGGHETFIGLINSLVHTIMYTYYLLASMKIDTSSWKRHITHIQLSQFVLIGFHCSQLFWENCGYPTFVPYLLVPQQLFMIVLFGDFYYKTYIKKKPVVSTKINDISTGVSNGKLKKQ